MLLTMVNESGQTETRYVVPTRTPMFYKERDSRAVLFVDLSAIHIHTADVYRAGTSHATDHGSFYMFDRSMWKRVGFEAVLEQEVTNVR